jgi:CYTH domain-containing protein
MEYLRKLLMIEIERKFLVNPKWNIYGDIDDPRMLNICSNETGKQGFNLIYEESIEQFYLMDTGSWTIRGRQIYHHVYNMTNRYLTLKSPIDTNSCHEYEPIISEEMYLDLKKNHPVIFKNRKTIVKNPAITWMIDCFANPEFQHLSVTGNDLLAMVEIEMAHPDIDIGVQVGEDHFLYREVTNDPRYRNSELYKLLGVR